MKVNFNVTKNYTSVKNFLKARGFSESLLTTYVNNQHLIRVNNKQSNLEDRITKGSKVEVILTNETNKIVLVNKPIEVVYEDRYLLIINKPHNLAATPTRATVDNNLSGMVASYFRSIKLSSKVHLVYRLDSETSGIILVAKHQLIHNLLSNLKIESKYRAKVVGKIKPDSGIIEKRISKLESSKERIESIKGEDTLTKYEVKHFENNESNLEAEIIKGRSPQLRLHFKLLGHPIVGDNLYGEKGRILNLQNYFIKFKHPITNRVISVKLKREWK
jgi:23S rRNA pseudouridine1911/1915/1917 synthase